jgi:hypothetical protein
VLIQARDELLEVWRSLVAYSNDSGQGWRWGGRGGSNSIADAEQLLCVLYPATNVEDLRLDNPDQTADDVLGSLRGLGTGIDVHRSLLRLLIEYMERYSDDSGAPLFGGGSYFEPVEAGGPETATEEQRALDVVDSFSMSTTLTLSVLGFLRVLRGGIRNPTTLAQLDHLQDLSSARLTAAMAGLLRSFTVNVFDIDSEPGQTMLETVNQAREPQRIVAERLVEGLNEIRGGLRQELSIGSGLMAEQLENRSQLFECGWSWGVIKGAPEIEYAKAVGGQRAGVADPRPILYFTTVALDGIQDLFSERTRVLGLLNEDQQRMAQALQLRWELTLKYWNVIATFGPAQWPLEDVPWRTSDGKESDYFTLMVSSMVVQQHLAAGSIALPVSLVRVLQVLRELAQRGRIVRRATAGDQALTVHDQGMRLTLIGTQELGPLQMWTVSSFSSLLLKRALGVASRIGETDERAAALRLCDQIWEHLLLRRFGEGPATGLWDQPSGAFPQLSGRIDKPSWYHTQRVVECLVVAAEITSGEVPVGPDLIRSAVQLLQEADRIFDQENSKGTKEAGASVRSSFQVITNDLERARDILERRPGTAIALLLSVLLELDSWTVARSNLPASQT